MRTSVSMRTVTLPKGKVTVFELVGVHSEADVLYTMFEKTLYNIQPPVLIDCTAATLSAGWRFLIDRFVMHWKDAVVCGLASAPKPGFAAQYVATREEAEAYFRAVPVFVDLIGAIPSVNDDEDDDILTRLSPDLAYATACIVNFRKAESVACDALGLFVCLSDTCRSLRIPLIFHGMNARVRDDLHPAAQQLIYRETDSYGAICVAIAEKEDAVESLVRFGTLHLSDIGNIRIITPRGPFIADKQLAGLDAALQGTEEKMQRIVVDLSEIKLVSSAFVGKMSALHMHCEPQGIPVLFCGIPQRLQTMLNHLGLNQVWNIVETRKAALLWKPKS